MKWNNLELVTWNVSVTSTVKNTISIEELNTILNAKYYLGNKDNLEFMDDQAKEIAYWQIDKADEFANKFHKSIKYSLDKDMITVYTNFDIEVTDNFTDSDVKIWTQGFQRLVVAYLDLSFTLLLNNPEYKVTKDTCYEFTKNLQKNEVIKVERI